MLAARLSPFRVAVMTCSRQNVVRPISRAVGSAPADGAAMCAANCSRGRPPLWGAQAARTFCTADHLAGQKDKDAVRCRPPPPPDTKQSSNSTVRPRRAPGSGC